MTEIQLKYHALEEDKRANRVREEQNQQTINENIRHNRQYEYETARHNLMSERISTVDLSIRNANLAEQARHNRQTELISMYGIQNTRESLAIEREKNAIQRARLQNETAMTVAQLKTEQARKSNLDAQTSKLRSDKTLVDVNTGIAKVDLRYRGAQNAVGIVTDVTDTVINGFRVFSPF